MAFVIKLCIYIYFSSLSTASDFDYSISPIRRKSRLADRGLFTILIICVW